MATINQLVPGAVLIIQKKLFRLDSFRYVHEKSRSKEMSVRLKQVGTEKIVEKNFTLNDSIEIAPLQERRLEFLYKEGKKLLFLDTATLDTCYVSVYVVGAQADYLKEGIEVAAFFYKEQVCYIELPPFLELEVIDIDEEKKRDQDPSRIATLETKAQIKVPHFVDVGDMIKVNVKNNEFVQRI